MDFCPLAKGECWGRACGLWAEAPHVRGCALRVAAEAAAEAVQLLARFLESTGSVGPVEDVDRR